MLCRAFPRQKHPANSYSYIPDSDTPQTITSFMHHWFFFQIELIGRISQEKVRLLIVVPF